MTVSELIEKLKNYPPDMIVLSESQEEGSGDESFSEPEVLTAFCSSRVLKKYKYTTYLETNETSYKQLEDEEKLEVLVIQGKYILCDFEDEEE